MIVLFVLHAAIPLIGRGVVLRRFQFSTDLHSLLFLEVNWSASFPVVVPVETYDVKVEDGVIYAARKDER